MNKYARTYIIEFQKNANPAFLGLLARSFGQGMKYLPKAIKSQYLATPGSFAQKALGLLKTYGIDLPKKNIMDAFRGTKNIINPEKINMPGEKGFVLPNVNAPRDPLNYATRIGTGLAEMTPAALAGAGTVGAGVAGVNALTPKPKPEPKPEPPGFFQILFGGNK